MSRSSRLSYIIAFILLLALALTVTIACIVLLLARTQATSSAAVPLAATAAAVSPDRTPSPASARQVSPAPSPHSLVATPDVNLEDLSLYQLALRPEFAADALALPDATRYFIQAGLDTDDPTTLNGLVRVRYTNTETVPLDDLYFRLYPNLPGYGGSMTIGQVVLNDEPVETNLEAQNSALRVLLDSPLPPGGVADVALPFQATLPTDPSAGYGLYAYADEVYALAGFYPTIPVYDDEGWNVEVAPPYGDATFTDAAFYQLELTVPEELTVATSGSTLDVQENGDGTRTWVAVGGPMRDFYVAMSPGYEVVSEEVGGTVVNSYYRSGQEAGGALALKYAVDALRLFSEEFGPYPYAELDVVATPTSAGGIEYPGAIVVAQRLYDEEGGFLELATAHEVAHQWWYGLVGSDQLDEPWLDEALTNYSAYMYYEGTAGKQRADFIKQRVFTDAYLTAQQERWDRRVAGPVASFSEAEYGGIVYGKGPLFFDEVRARLGDEAFLTGLRAYLQENRYGIAYPDELIAAFEEASEQQIDDLYRFWILGQAE